MRDVFKGWRRKVGVVTLGLACGFAATWVRSFYVVSEIVVSEDCSWATLVRTAAEGICFDTVQYTDGYLKQGESIRSHWVIPYIALT